MQRLVTYFEKPGRENTEECLKIAIQAIKESGYKHLVVASTTGETGLKIVEALKGLNINLVIVTHSTGFKAPNTQEMHSDVRERIIQNGAKVLTGTMITHSIETAFSQKFQGLYPTHIVAQTLRRFGEGPKVCIECVMMAVDAGLIPEGEEVLAIAGTAYGADTVMLIKSAASKRFLDLKVLEILAKPRA
ncbi:MAG: hypothetical protein N2257_02690 [Thermodesulfovibrionales bacterium]|nr:hypothetical protein [Thermodesulfovibrionales bacterium]